MISTPATEGTPDTTEFRGKVRPRDRETSWEAASAQTNHKTGQLQVIIYEILLLDGPRTDDEIRHALRFRDFPHTRSGVSTRRHELGLAGWVVADGTAPSDAGKPSTRWRAVADDEPAPEPRPAAAAPARKPSAKALAAVQSWAMLELGLEAEDVEAIITNYLNPGCSA